MKTVYTIKDTVMQECNAPYIANNDAHARMIFDRSVENARKAGFKQEFKLLRLGAFDETTGKIVGLVKPEEVTFDDVVDESEQKEFFD